MLIEKPGVYSSIPIERYHHDAKLCAGPSISSSGLRTIFTESPSHYWNTSPYNPKRRPPKESEAFTLGRAAHILLLGEDDFLTQFIMRPEKLQGEAWQGNRTVCKAWLAQQKSEGRTVLLPSQIEQIRGMAKSLSDVPLIRNGILNGEIEQTLVCRDEKTGIYLKSRPDAVPTDSGDFADLKTSTEFGDELDRSVSKYRYDMQAGLTGMCYRAIFKRQMTSFSFVFVEKTPPHSVEIVTLSSEDIEQAEKDLRVAIDTFAWCMKAGHWFGPAGTQNDARFVHISECARKNAEYRRFFLEREIREPQIETRITEPV